MIEILHSAGYEVTEFVFMISASATCSQSAHVEGRSSTGPGSTYHCHLRSHLFICRSHGSFAVKLPDEPFISGVVRLTIVRN